MIGAIKIEEQGLYYCQTEDSEGERHRRELHVHVRRTYTVRHWFLAPGRDDIHGLTLRSVYGDFNCKDIPNYF